MSIPENKFPSKAFRDSKGEYHHDPDNQLLAQQEQDGLLGAREVAQKQHPFGSPGYCFAHKVLGCLDCNL